MNRLEESVCQITGATACELGDVIQSLWSGYGVIQRVRLHGCEISAAIVKHIDLSQIRTNRRGWSGDNSHQRKVRSYEIESSFYRSFACKCSELCRVPMLIGSVEKPNGTGRVLILEDLDAAGFGLRKQNVGKTNVKACLKWLANFHSTFLGCAPQGLWPIGTYWHLATRPEELAAMDDGPLKDCAAAIDERLNDAKYQTLLHGDAKLANFCFSSTCSDEVAAVDFQYVGGGCGMKDVAYLFSCLGERQAESYQDIFLDFYFNELRSALDQRSNKLDLNELEAEWRELYAYAWADFCRFLAGWFPGHWKLNENNDRLTQKVLNEFRDC